MPTDIDSVTCHTQPRVVLCITENGVHVHFYVASEQRCRKPLDIPYH